MKRTIIAACAMMIAGALFLSRACAEDKDTVGKAATRYFDELFGRLKAVAEQSPDKDNFRQIMKPVAEETDGFFGATLIDPDFVIREVYNPGNFLARGFDLKKVKELKDFYKMMKEKPAPQLSEPARGSLLQPRLISLRYPVLDRGELKNIVSMMVLTESFLRAAGLKECKAYKIICMGKLAERKGVLSQDHKEVALKLPSTEWVIQYDE